MAETKCILATAVCVSVCLSIAAFPHYCTDPDVTLGNGRGCCLVVYYWTNLQSVHGFRCYDNMALNAKCQRVLVLALCLVLVTIFQVNLGQPVPSRPCTSTCSGRQPVRIHGTRFFSTDRLPVTQPTEPKHWRILRSTEPSQGKSRTGLILSYPPPDSRGSGIAVFILHLTTALCQLGLDRYRYWVSANTRHYW